MSSTIIMVANQTLAVPKLSLSINYLDFSVRAYDLLIHLVYFVYVALKPNSELRSRTFLLLHNVNAATFAISIVQVSFINVKMPSFADPTLNHILCLITEQFWACTKYARVYALLLLAVYRYTACLDVRLYKLVNSRLVYLFELIVACWLVSLVIPNIFKFSLNTTYSVYYCTDGFAHDRISISIVYYVVNTVLSSFLPTLVILALYWQIYRKLRGQTLKAGLVASSSHDHSIHSKKLAKFSHQFIIINVITAVSNIFSTFIDFVNVIAAYPSFNYLQYDFQIVRPVFRIVTLFTQSLVPVVSLYFSCCSWKSIVEWFRRRKNQRITGSEEMINNNNSINDSRQPTLTLVRNNHKNTPIG